MRSFNHIVSLGSFCQTTYQLKKRFPHYKSNIFDWWVTSTNGLVRMFEEDFQNVFRHENLQIVDEDGKKAVMCTYYGIMHYHDFERHEDRVCLPSLQDGGEIRPIFIRAAIQRNLERVAYLYKRLCELSGDVLFVRLTDGVIKHYDQNGSWNDDLIDRFFIALARVAPDINPTLLLLNTRYTESRRSDVIIESVNKYDATGWNGSDRGWDELFHRLDFHHDLSQIAHDAQEEDRHRLTVERTIYGDISDGRT